MSEILRRLESFDIDGGPVRLPFAARLARENRWDRQYAERVVCEYKRFVYLAMTAGRPMTPSDQVDQAWHLHLAYTKSYWQRMCGDLLGRPLHHNPTEGGSAEATKYHAQYDDTLRQYRETFGQDAPADIWPPAAIRFGPGSEGVRIDDHANWVIRKSTVKSVGVGLAAAIAITVSIGCAGNLNPFDLPGTTYLLFLIPALIGAMILGIMYRKWASGPSLNPTDESVELGWDETAYLAGGPRRLATAAIARIVDRNLAEVDPLDTTRIKRKGPLPDSLSPVELAACKALPISQTGKMELARLARETEAALAPKIHEMQERGWWLSAPAATFITLKSATPMALVWLIFGLGRYVNGMMNNKPSGFLLATLIVSFIILFIMAFARNQLTKAGEQLLERIRSRNQGLQKSESWDDVGLPSGTKAAMAVALFGTAVLVGTQYEQLKSWYPRQSGDGGSSGCGTGCGSSGDGGGGGGDGGGGGCGGCGGGGD